MNYDEFIEEVKNNLLSHLSGDFSNAEIKISPNNKVNYETHSLSVTTPELGDKVAPSLDLKMNYERYKKNQDMDEILEHMAFAITSAYENIDKIPELANPEMKEENVFMQLINTESNPKLLAESPHRPFHDMSVIYRVKMGLDEGGLMSVKVTDDVMKNMGLDEERLFELAAEQTPKILPPKIQSMNEIFLGMMGETGLGGHEGEELLESMDMGVDMLVISNKYNIHGATNMVFDSVLHDAAERLGQDIYLLPSSTHEILAVGQSMGDPEELQAMVNEINQSTVGEQDRLSNQVFAYNMTTRELTVAATAKVMGIRDIDYERESMVAERGDYSIDTPQPAHAR